VFHGIGKDDVEKHWFTCESIYSIKRVIDDVPKITQLETMLRSTTLIWYMTYKDTTPTIQERLLDEIK